MGHIKNFTELNEVNMGFKMGDLKKFINDYLDGINNPIIISALTRMLENEKFTKFEDVIYDLNEEDIEKLRKIKPELKKLIEISSNIKDMIK